MTLAELYEAYETNLHDYAHRLVKDQDQADDLVQDTFIRAMGHLPLLATLKPYQQRAWLQQTLKNLFLDELRTQRRQAALLTALEDEERRAVIDPFAQSLSSNPLHSLPSDLGELFEMRYTLGMDSSEIGAALGIPAATVRSRLHFAMKKLRLYQQNYL